MTMEDLKCCGNCHHHDGNRCEIDYAQPAPCEVCKEWEFDDWPSDERMLSRVCDDLQIMQPDVIFKS